ncbi:D-cysteine desulfhydrase family protein [Clostridiaceae bacterium HSG29]|nr:D-cysteine desulfhydrase family protein [Clostridiaceae bacterium HSG29]
MKIPKKINLAFLPTPVYKIEKLSKELNQNIFIKRDDLTGVEFSGNKIRKLEYAVFQALEENAEVLITCGGIQSNHARATAMVAAKLGLKSHLVLRSDSIPYPKGNHLLDMLVDAEITYLSQNEFQNNLEFKMEEIKKEYEKKGIKAYIIPLGASNGIGNFGYYNCMDEIIEYENKNNITFDTVICTVGSGGTFSGLFLNNLINKHNKKIIGFNVSNDSDYFKEKIEEIVHESMDLMNIKIEFSKDDIEIIDGYVGRGYALNTSSELEFIKKIAKSEGIILDPVYTAKCFKGMYENIKKDRFKDSTNILFIHTGGLFGLFPKADEFDF